MPTDDQDLTGGASIAVSCLAWLGFFGLVGCLVLTALLMAVRNWCDDDELRGSRALLLEQMEELRRGDVDCLVQPDPRFLDELLADAACASKIRELYLGGDVSDTRLGRLRELSNLKSVVLLSANAPDKFLKELQGMATVEELSLVWCRPSPQGIEHIANLPNLKRFGLCVGRFDAGDWESLRKALPRCECSLVVSHR
jgi:hypothetical protein